MTPRSILALAVLLVAAADIPPYAITTVEQSGRFIGCLALKPPAGIAVLASGSHVALFVTAPTFTVVAQQTVTGTWSIDGGQATAFQSQADSANTLTLDVPDDADVVQALTTGRQLAIETDHGGARLSLAALGQAFLDLARCMRTQRAP